MLFMTAALAALTLVQQTDTTLAVSHDTRLSVNNFEGAISVTGWNRNEVRVQATGGDEDKVKVRLGGGVLRISQNMRYGPESVDLRISVPAWMRSTSRGCRRPSVSGTQGPCRRNPSRVTSPAGGAATSRSVRSRAVSAEDIQGYVEVTSVEGDVVLRNIAGGQRLWRSTADPLEGITRPQSGATPGGDITFAGSIVTAAATDHDPARRHRRRKVRNRERSTFSGEFESTSPVTVTRTQSGGNRFSFTIGSGSANLDLEAFDGSIRFEYGR
jgi:hypothetical protein